MIVEILTSIPTVASTYKALREGAEGLLQARDEAAFAKKRQEFQALLNAAYEAVLASQQERLEVLQRVEALEKEIAGLKAWDAEKSRYELHQVTEGAYVYRLKESERNNEPDHYICPTCYDAGRRSVLQETRTTVGRTTILVCNGCGSAIVTVGNVSPDVAQIIGKLVAKR